MNAREFLALSDQLMGFQTALSGALNKEVEALREARRSLDEANNLVKLKQTLSTQEADFETHKAAVEASLSKLKEGLDLKEVALEDQAAELGSREEAHNKLVSQSQETLASAERVTAEHATDAATIATLRAAATSENNQRSSELDARESLIAARESTLERKLAALKEPV